MTQFAKGYKRAPLSLGNVLILGLGTSGRVTCAYCTMQMGKRVESVTVYAGKRTEESELFAQSAQRMGATIIFDSESVEGSYDLCIASPGISEFSDFYRNAQAASAEVISEVEFAWRESPQDSIWIALTGTNGKTTTTALTAHLLQTAGFRAAAVGNIGDTCLGAVGAGETHVYVAEVSSYQLASTRYFAPDVAVILNITPDHLAWHRSHENYVAAKYKVLANLATQPHAVAILDATNDTVRAKVRELKSLDEQARGFSYIPLGTSAGIAGDMRTACGSENAAFLREDGMLVVARGGREIELVHSSDLQIPGAHNQGNALVAAAAALACGADEDKVRAGLKSFTSLEHRIEACGSVQGIVCYNDSKATNVDATLKALAAFDPQRPIVMLGGDDKHTDLQELVEAAVAHCKAVVCYGASGERFLEAFNGANVPVHAADHMEDAFDAALSLATEGDIVLLSPACASFDEFDNFEQRGRIFKELVVKRQKP